MGPDAMTFVFWMLSFKSAFSLSSFTFIKRLFSSSPSAIGASLVAQMVKCLPAMWETQVRSLGQEDPLEKGMVTHSSTLAWKIPWTEGPGRLQSIGSQRVRHDWSNLACMQALNLFLYFLSLKASTASFHLKFELLGSLKGTFWDESWFDLCRVVFSNSVVSGSLRPQWTAVHARLP